MGSPTITDDHSSSLSTFKVEEVSDTTPYLQVTLPSPSELSSVTPGTYSYTVTYTSEYTPYGAQTALTPYTTLEQVITLEVVDDNPGGGVYRTFDACPSGVNDPPICKYDTVSSNVFVAECTDVNDAATCAITTVNECELSNGRQYSCINITEQTNCAIQGDDLCTYASTDLTPSFSAKVWYTSTITPDSGITLKEEASVTLQTIIQTVTSTVVIPADILQEQVDFWNCAYSGGLTLSNLEFYKEPVVVGAFPEETLATTEQSDLDYITFDLTTGEVTYHYENKYDFEEMQDFYLRYRIKSDFGGNTSEMSQFTALTYEVKWTDSCDSALR